MSSQKKTKISQRDSIENHSKSGEAAEKFWSVSVDMKAICCSTHTFGSYWRASRRKTLLSLHKKLTSLVKLNLLPFFNKTEKESQRPNHHVKVKVF